MITFLKGDHTGIRAGKSSKNYAREIRLFLALFSSESASKSSRGVGGVALFGFWVSLFLRFKKKGKT
jgi:hypothetical protein